MDISKFKSLRERKNLSQYKFAEMLGVAQSTVAMWETGTNIPTADKLPKIAEILNCTIDDLFGRTEETEGV